MLQQFSFDFFTKFTHDGLELIRILEEQGGEVLFHPGLLWMVMQLLKAML